MTGLILEILQNFSTRYIRFRIIKLLSNFSCAERAKMGQAQKAGWTGD